MLKETGKKKTINPLNYQKISKKRIILLSSTFKESVHRSNFLDSFKAIAGDEDFCKCQFFFLDESVDVHTLLEKGDYIVLDGMVVSGGKDKRLCMQVRKELLSSCNRKKKAFFLPRSPERRRQIFSNIVSLNKLVKAMVDLFNSGKQFLSRPLVMRPNMERRARKKKIITTPPLCVHICLPNWLEKRSLEAVRLKDILEKHLGTESSVLVLENIDTKAVRAADIVFLGVQEVFSEPEKVVSSRRKRSTRKKVKRRQGIESKSDFLYRYQKSVEKLVDVDFRRLHEVISINTIKPSMEIVFMDIVLPLSLWKISKRVSSFLEYPFTEETVRVVLQRAVTSIAKRRASKV